MGLNCLNPTVVDLDHPTTTEAIDKLPTKVDDNTLYFLSVGKGWTIKYGDFYSPITYIGSSQARSKLGLRHRIEMKRSKGDLDLFSGKDFVTQQISYFTQKNRTDAREKKLIESFRAVTGYLPLWNQSGKRALRNKENSDRLFNAKELRNYFSFSDADPKIKCVEFGTDLLQSRFNRGREIK